MVLGRTIELLQRILLFTCLCVIIGGIVLVFFAVSAGLAFLVRFEVLIGSIFILAIFALMVLALFFA